MIDFSLFSRRDFLRGVGAFSAANLALWAGGCESWLQIIESRPIRRNISNLSPTDPIIATFKAAVTAMRKLPSSDLRSWQNQAEIHYNKCIHGNWLWLPWHRAYLVYFERICRKLAGDNNFALPYWNWITHPSIPDVFWGDGNPLYDPNRWAKQGVPADPSYVGASKIESILNEPSFDLFASAPPTTSDLHFAHGASTGMLEGTPHNNIHGFVCGDMCTFHSPLDPVFWTHHNMIDCLWVDWNINRNHPNTNDPNWVNFQFTDFVDENGNPVTLDVLTTLLFPLFTYQYEPCSPGDPPSRKEMKALEKFLRTGAPSKLEFTKRFESRQSLTAAVGSAITGVIKVETEALRNALQDPKNRVVLTVDGVDTPEKRDFFVRVYLNKGVASADTPIDDPHYAGSFGFFFDDSAWKIHEGKAGAAGRPKTGYLVDVTPTLNKLSQAGALSSAEVDVSFVPIRYGSRAYAKGQLTLKRLELGIARF